MKNLGMLEPEGRTSIITAFVKGVGILNWNTLIRASEGLQDSIRVSLIALWNLWKSPPTLLNLPQHLQSLHFHSPIKEWLYLQRASSNLWQRNNDNFKNCVRFNLLPITPGPTGTIGNECTLALWASRRIQPNGGLNKKIRSWLKNHWLHRWYTYWDCPFSRRPQQKQQIAESCSLADINVAYYEISSNNHFWWTVHIFGRPVRRQPTWFLHAYAQWLE